MKTRNLRIQFNVFLGDAGKLSLLPVDAARWSWTKASLVVGGHSGLCPHNQQLHPGDQDRPRYHTHTAHHWLQHSNKLFPLFKTMTCLILWMTPTWHISSLWMTQILKCPTSEQDYISYMHSSKPWHMWWTYQIPTRYHLTHTAHVSNIARALHWLHQTV